MKRQGWRNSWNCLQVLYVLTLVTTLIMPTHLLTGIFGMNWQDEAATSARCTVSASKFMPFHTISRSKNTEDGKPVVPGLGVMEEHRGYYLFWGILAACYWFWRLDWMCICEYSTHMYSVKRVDAKAGWRHKGITEAVQVQTSLAASLIWIEGEGDFLWLFRHGIFTIIHNTLAYFKMICIKLV